MPSRSLGPALFTRPKDEPRETLLAEAKEVGMEGMFPSHSDTTVSVVVLGCPEVCWRCGVITTNVVGVAPAGATDPYDLLPFTDDPVKELVAALLDEAARHQAGVGRIRSRWSRTTGSAYVSNGCRRCDALQGDHYIMESIAGIDERTMRELVAVAEAEMSAAGWTELLEACLGV